MRFRRVWPRPLSRPAERLLILGATPLAEQLVREIARRARPRCVVVGVLDDRTPSARSAIWSLYQGRLQRLKAAIDELHPHCIVVALAERRGQLQASILLQAYLSRDIVIEDVAQTYERLTGKLALESLTPLTIVASRRFKPSWLARTFARGLSLSAALVALVAFAPLLALIAVAVKLDSPGPVLFTQQRVGARGRPFTLMKFRTMRDGERPSEWENDNWHRVTRVGKWLRASRLDELPQLVNILRGEMNLVGPRPHPVSNLELFTLVARNLSELTGAAIGCYALRLLVRPGLTGWAQVRYRYANDLEEEIEKLRYDLYYVKHLSPWLDLRILCETVPVLSHGRLLRGADPSVATADRGAAVGPVQPFGIFRNLGHHTGAS